MFGSGRPGIRLVAFNLGGPVADADHSKTGSAHRASKKYPNCDGKKLCQAEHTIQGVKWLELGVYAKIGQYHLYQA